MGVAKGRPNKSQLKCGVCGEHGGDPQSIRVLRRSRPRLRLVQPVSSPHCPPGGGAGGTRARAVGSGQSGQVGTGSQRESHENGPSGGTMVRQPWPVDSHATRLGREGARGDKLLRLAEAAGSPLPGLARVADVGVGLAVDLDDRLGRRPTFLGEATRAAGEEPVKFGCRAVREFVLQGPRPLRSKPNPAGRSAGRPL